jgi:hypothetical protein
MNRVQDILSDISAVVEYLENTGELRDYCACIASGDDRYQSHIYRHVQNIDIWLARRNEYAAGPKQARTRADKARNQIAAAWQEHRSRPPAQTKLDRRPTPEEIEQAAKHVLAELVDEDPKAA